MHPKHQAWSPQAQTHHREVSAKHPPLGAHHARLARRPPEAEGHGQKLQRGPIGIHEETAIVRRQHGNQQRKKANRARTAERSPPCTSAGTFRRPICIPYGKLPPSPPCQENSLQAPIRCACGFSISAFACPPPVFVVLWFCRMRARAFVAPWNARTKPARPGG